MAFSQQQITDVTTVITNGPNGATQALANVASGVIMDYSGNLNVCLLKLQELKILLNMIIADTDASDATNLGLLQGVYNDLV